MTLYERVHARAKELAKKYNVNSIHYPRTMNTVTIEVLCSEIENLLKETNNGNKRSNGKTKRGPRKL